jgi:lysophospholipase L1-like esterase
MFLRGRRLLRLVRDSEFGSLLSILNITPLFASRRVRRAALVVFTVVVLSMLTGLGYGRRVGSAGSTVLLIGDSVVAGVGDDSSEFGIAGRLKQLTGGKWSVDSVGLPGATSNRLIAYIKHQLAPDRVTPMREYLKSAKVVILSAGLNDFWSETGPRRTVANLRAAAKLIACAAQRETGGRPHIAIATLLPTTLEAQQVWSDAVNSLLVGSSGPLAITTPRFHDMERSLLGADGLHPSERGYDWLAFRSAAVLDRFAEAPPPGNVDCGPPRLSETSRRPNAHGGRKKLRRPSVLAPRVRSDDSGDRRRGPTGAGK